MTRKGRARTPLRAARTEMDVKLFESAYIMTKKDANKPRKIKP